MELGNVGMMVTRGTDDKVLQRTVMEIYPNAQSYISICVLNDIPIKNVNKFVIDNDLDILFIDDDLNIDYDKIKMNKERIFINEIRVEARGNNV